MENDDDRLAAAFRAAVQDTPEAGFDHEDVLAGSRRLARRRRMLVTGGVAAAVIVLAGGVTTGVVLTRDGGTLTSAAAPAPERAEQAGPGSAADAAAPRAAAAPSAPGSGAPLGPAAGDCVNPQDPELRALADAALPGLAGAREAPTTMICGPGGGREVNLEVTDGALTGLFTVVYTPAGQPPARTATAVGWVTAEVPTASGGTVVVTSRGDADSGGVPFADDVRPLAEALGPRL